MNQSFHVMPGRPLLYVCIAALMFAAGCSNAGEGALTGAGVGALSGLAIGSLGGEAGAGAAIGAIVGGVGGAVIGDQNRRSDEAAAKAASAPPPQPAASAAPAPTAHTVVVSQPQPTVVVVQNQPKSSQKPNYTAGHALGWLVGDWRIRGTIDSGSGAPLAASGSATVSADKTYFLRIDLRFIDPRTQRSVEGTSIITQTGGSGVEMINVFSSSPKVRRFQGNVDESGTTFTFFQVEPKDSSRRLILRTSYGTGFTATVWKGDKVVESYEFVK